MVDPWRRLAALREASKTQHLSQLFAENPRRFQAFSAAFDDLLLDYSKTSLTHEIRGLLLAAAAAADVAGKRDAMFSGAQINTTEQRAVLHVALRNLTDAPILVDGADVMPGVKNTIEAAFRFSESIRSGDIAAADGASFTDVLNIGIGGSDLGPAMVTAALAPYHDGPRVHFVSNIDAAHLTDIIRRLDPARTLVVIASKTFSTVETMTNAHSARRWVSAALGEAAVARHFVAVSTALDRVAAFGIAADRIFGFWNWVGGRYSVWSAVGLPVIIAIGGKNFRDFLAGAHEMDKHFLTAAPERNLPILLGLVGIWHRNICGYGARAVLPYNQRLARFPAYLQQLDMESNGKRVTLSGRPVAYQTGPLVWGEPGTSGQHAFFQLLHQGSDIIPCEFLIAAAGHEPGLREHHDLLVANCLAQSEALMKGRTLEEASAALTAAGKTPAEIAALAPHRVFPGNRPSITLAYGKLTPRTLGRLIALYEHRVFVEAAVWGINPFDQWGVELGKELATRLLPVVAGDKLITELDASTAGLVTHLHTQKGRNHD